MVNLKKYQPKRLFTRGIVLIAAPLLILQLVITYLILERYWDRVTQSLSETSAREIATIIAEPNQKRRERIASRLGLKVRLLPDASLPTKKELPAFDFFLHQTVTEELKQKLPYPIWVNTQGVRNNIDIRLAYKGDILQIIVARKRVYAEKVYQLIVWVAAAGILVFAIAVIFLRNQVRPIQRLAIAAKRFGRGLDVRDFKPTGASEVREAGAAFLTMRNNLHNYIAQRTYMLSAISHDMRTALTRFKLQLAFLSENKETAALTRDVDNMTSMLNGYLDFARGEGQVEKPVLLDLEKVLCERTEPYCSQIELKLMSPLMARLRPQAIRRCLDNLIDNAMTYGNKVVICGRRVEKGIEILIDDDGPGIEEQQYETAFRPFHRLDKARNQNISGTGLGLAIARDIVHATGGSITLSKSPQKGLRVRLFFNA